MNKMKRIVLASILALGFITNSNVFAASDEIQVYTDEMNEPGEYGVELHLNYVPDGEKTSSYEGGSPSQHMLQATPEFSYGITKNWEAGMYVPVAREENGMMYGNGLRLRMKYIGTPEKDANMFWGLNVEYGYSNLRVSESEWGMELRPIIGVRTDNWLLSFNPIMNMDLDSKFNHQPQFEPALKLARQVTEGVYAGLEYYGEYGYIDNLKADQQRVNYLYAALDIEQNGLDLNVGIGRGDSNASDSWIAKAIVAFPLK